MQTRSRAGVMIYGLLIIRSVIFGSTYLFTDHLLQKLDTVVQHFVYREE